MSLPPAASATYAHPVPGPPPHEIPAETKKHLAGIRAKATTARADLANGAEWSGPLEQVAWISAALGPGPELDAAIERARQARCMWRELSEAVGNGDDRDEARRLQQRHDRRQR